MEDTLDESMDASGGAGTRIACCVITQVAVSGAPSICTPIMALLATSAVALMMLTALGLY